LPRLKPPQAGRLPAPIKQRARAQPPRRDDAVACVVPVGNYGPLIAALADNARRKGSQSCFSAATLTTWTAAAAVGSRGRDAGEGVAVARKGGIRSVFSPARECHYRVGPDSGGCGGFPRAGGDKDADKLDAATALSGREPRAYIYYRD